MSLINDNSIKYFKRNEEKIIYEKICNLNTDEKGNEIIILWGIWSRKNHNS